MDAGWFEPVRAYCERADAGFWAEPLNAASNAAFLVAAALAGRRATRGFGGAVGFGAGPLSRTGEGAHRGFDDAAATATFDPAALALSLLVAVVGLGSFLFHTIAVRWAMLADVIPIALFI